MMTTPHTPFCVAIRQPGGMQVSEAEPLGQMLTRLRWASERCIEGTHAVAAKGKEPRRHSRARIIPNPLT